LSSAADSRKFGDFKPIARFERGGGKGRKKRPKVTRFHFFPKKRSLSSLKGAFGGGGEEEKGGKGI